ncbi:TetR/AcrR family transcriptional regulator [Arabiibacter massiliensis]|uniref:TetR/AcrR family transcriptional regulator n=1 Tax=Arabiibacter massiliensis TaxID=1870985 RepID=UPI0009BA6928|nr:TetR/AcrR family transcriptional regulator [Arabiibacter massiliensis]
MPEQRVTREAVLDAALAIVREQGEPALSARAVAQRAGCSVQPIYSLFGDMEGLVRELYDHARAWTEAYHRAHAGDGRNPFESNGLSHLRLAREERPLFHFLYLSPHMEATGFEEVYESVAVDGVQRCIEELGHLSPEAARKLYLHMIVYAHGMAAMLATGAQFTDEELRERMDEAFRGLLTAVRS